MSFDITKTAFNQVDTNQDKPLSPDEFDQFIRDGQLTPDEFNQWIRGDGSGATVDGGDAASFNTSSFNTATGVQNYATDAQGNFIDPNPFVQHPLKAPHLTFCGNSYMAYKNIFKH